MVFRRFFCRFLFFSDHILLLLLVTGLLFFFCSNCRSILSCHMLLLPLPLLLAFSFLSRRFFLRCYWSVLLCLGSGFGCWCCWISCHAIFESDPLYTYLYVVHVFNSIFIQHCSLMFDREVDVSKHDRNECKMALCRVQYAFGFVVVGRFSSSSFFLLCRCLYFITHSVTSTLECFSVLMQSPYICLYIHAK